MAFSFNFQIFQRWMLQLLETQGGVGGERVSWPFLIDFVGNIKKKIFSSEYSES